MPIDRLSIVRYLRERADALPADDPERERLETRLAWHEAMIGCGQRYFGFGEQMVSLTAEGLAEIAACRRARG